MKIVKLPKNFILFLLFPLVLFLFAKSALAYYTREDYNKAFTESVFVEPGINQPSFTWETAQALTASLNTMIIGCTSQNCPKEVRGTGAVNGVSNLIATMYANPPASGVTYLADLGRNLGLAQPAYAQGTGFSGLSPILPIWKAFRNIAYLFFTIIFIAIGFAIMFRVKISPQAVVTIQSALPRIIMTLILVTFSYAIAGFLIDLMYVAIFLAITFLAYAGIPSIGPGDIPGLQAQFTGGFGGAIQGIFQNIGLGITVFVALGSAIGGIVALIAGAGAVPAVLVGVGLFLLIFGVTVLFLIFKLFWELLKAYISIIVAVIFAPLQIMLGAIPGINLGFGTWFRGLLANILVFPAVAVFLLIGRSLMSISGLPGTGGGIWAPPMFGFSPEIIPAIIALGILFLVTKVPEMVKNALGVRPFPYGAAIGEAFGLPRMAAGPGVAGGGEYLIGRLSNRQPGQPPSAGEQATRAAIEALAKKIGGR